MWDSELLENQHNNYTSDCGNPVNWTNTKEFWNCDF